MSDNTELKELLELLESSKQKAQERKLDKADVRSVRSYIEKCGIKAGTKRIHNYIIFYHYRVHFIMKYKYPDKAKKIPFFRTLSKYFEKARIGKQRYYLLDPTPFDLTREGKLEAKAYDQEYKKRSKDYKKRFKKIKDETSGTK